MVTGRPLTGHRVRPPRSPSECRDHRRNPSHRRWPVPRHVDPLTRPWQATALNTVALTRPLTPVCGSCRCSGEIPPATSSRSTTPTESFCRRSAALKRPGGQPPAELMSSWRRVGRLAGTYGVRSRPSLGARVVDAVAPVPVIAADGIGDARGGGRRARAGCCSGVAGYPVLLAQEMPIHEEYRGRLMDAAETDAQWYATCTRSGGRTRTEGGVKAGSRLRGPLPLRWQPP